MLLLARFALTAVFTVVLVVSGVWAAWDDASRALAPGDDERGTITLHACDDEACTGTFAPRGAPPGEDRREVTMPQPLGREPGERLSVALRPGTAEVVRTGAAGALYAALPLTGALLLASVIVAGGLRLYRVAAVTAGVAVTALLATFVLW
ncbi:hypothetical protein JK356_18610 [Streptomyces sp. 7-21]|nr:hypothetical protein [Streptomyces sp. 7-21]